MRLTYVPMAFWPLGTKRKKQTNKQRRKKAKIERKKERKKESKKRTSKTERIMRKESMKESELVRQQTHVIRKYCPFVPFSLTLIHKIQHENDRVQHKL